MIKTITQPDILIVRYSSIVETEEYSWLKRVLLNRVSLTHEEIHNTNYLTDDQKSFLIYSYVEWAQRIAEEWKSTSNEPLQTDSKLVCELCGNPNCKCLFEIKNTITGVTLNVGSSCINKFESISKSFKGYKDINQLIKKRNIEFNKLNRESILKEKIGDKSDTYQKWQRTNFDYVLPHKKEIDRNNLISDFITLHNDFICKGNINNDNTILFKTLQQTKEKIDSIDKSIISKQKKYSIQDYFCPYFLEKWIKDTYDDSNSIIHQIKKNNGKLDNTTIRYIYNDEYLNNFKEIFNELLTTSPLKINNIINNEIHFKIVGYTSDLYISSKIFMEKFGHHIFDKKLLINNEILSILKANANSDSTLSEIIELFNDLMTKNNYKIITKEIIYSDNIIQIKNYLVYIQEKKYASKLNNLEDIFLQNCIKYLFNNVSNESSKKICNIINKINNWSDLDELKEYKDVKLY